MRTPSLYQEKKLLKKGFKKVACLDEAGRGALSGPVVAAAILINLTKFKKIRKIKDSKKLSSKKREEIFKIIKKNPQIEWGIGKVSEKIIDKINILEATKLAMKRAIKNLEKNLQRTVLCKLKKKRLIDFLILDGNFKLDLPIPQKSIVKGDEKVFSCALASIIAKVTRDKIMEKYAKKFPKYFFEKHKGYPTPLHLKMLKKYGPCKIHRKSFSPIKNLLKFKKGRKSRRKLTWKKNQSILK
jgi:ribonuclease HII